jgi:hypothetical protein
VTKNVHRLLPSRFARSFFETLAKTIFPLEQYFRREELRSPAFHGSVFVQKLGGACFPLLLPEFTFSG